MCRKSFIEESDGTRGTVRCESIGGDSSTKGRISHSEAEQWRRSLIQKVQQLEALPNRGRYDPKAPGQYHGYPELLCAKEGTYKVRFYVDSENELYRSVFIHQSSSLKIPCFDPSSCAICQNVKILNKKWKGVRRYSRKEICFAYVWIYRGIGKYARQSGTGLKMLWGFRRFADEIARILSGLELEAIARLSDPTCPFPPLVINSLDYGVEIIMNLSKTIRRSAPPLPGYVLPLSQSWFPVDAAIDLKYIDNFIAGMNRAYKNSL